MTLFVNMNGNVNGKKKVAADTQSFCISDDPNDISPTFDDKDW